MRRLRRKRLFFNCSPHPLLLLLLDDATYLFISFYFLLIYFLRVRIKLLRVGRIKFLRVDMISKGEVVGSGRAEFSVSRS